jgi:colanic acid/amylovoran biosynthesis glycosyltransferase
MNSGNSSDLPPLAYVAGAFPLRSETFVYREVRGLRERGWPVVAVSLNQPPTPPAELADLEKNRIVAYAYKSALLVGIVSEILKHPLRSLQTLLTAACDAASTEERTPLLVRLKIPIQALVSLNLARQLRILGVQHIHCHFAHAPTTLGMYTAIQLQIPFSFTGHANDIFQRRALL